MNFKQVVAYFGSDATEAGIRSQFALRLKNYANLLKHARAAGLDCKDVKSKVMLTIDQFASSVILHSTASLPSRSHQNADLKKEIATIMGSDVTPNGLRFQFTDRFRPVAKRQLDIL
jgi:hypothetical protein